MAGGNGKGLIAVATSIPPATVRQDAARAVPEYQALCIQSWIGNGFRIMSINHPDEIPDLAARYPEITFVPTSRNASGRTGRKNPYIADLLLALKEAREPVLGIINSDILFEPSRAWAEHLPSLVGKTMVVANRYDADSLLHGVLRQYCGFDCFFFDKATALHALEDSMPYAMGVPWWDYWLPCVALLNDRSVTVVDRPATLHLAHKPAYSPNIWSEFAQIFAQSVIRKFEKQPRSAPDVIATLMPSFHEIASSPPERHESDSMFEPFGKIFVPAIRKSTMRWEPTGDAPPDTQSAHLIAIFERFEKRFAAGKALRKARTLSVEKRLSDIGPELVAALNEVTDDADVLLVLAEISFIRGDFETASNLLAKAVEQRPDAAFPLHMHGNVLRAAGRHEEALACFNQILKLEPANQPAHLAAAKTLWNMDRQRASIAFLEEAVAHNPDFLQAIALCDSYRKRIRSPLHEAVRRIPERFKSIFSSRARSVLSRGRVASSRSPPHAEH